MKTIANSVKHAALIQAMLLVQACGGGGGGGEPTAAPPASPPVEAPAPVPAEPPAPGPAPGALRTGDVALYLATSNSGDTYDPYTGITIHHNSQNVIRFVPASKQVSVVATNDGPDFAQSTIYPYTVDGRFFVRRETPATTASASHSLMEWNAKSGAPMVDYPGYRLFSSPYQSGIGCSAVLGQRYYFKAASGNDILTGRLWGGDFRMATLDNPLPTALQLMPRDDTDNCKGALRVAGGKLYDAEYALGAVRLYRRDPTTARTVESVTLNVTEAGSYVASSYRFAFDDGAGYFARQRSDGRIQLWRYAFGGSPLAVLVHETDLPHFELKHLDVDEGRFAVAGKSSVLVLDPAAGDATLHSLPFDIYAMQILHVRP